MPSKTDGRAAPSPIEARMNKVKVGFFSFTEITDPAAHHSYNEWHMLDHMPEQFPLRGIVGGERWVSTPACRDARRVSESRLDPIHYVTTYLMTEPVDETLFEFMALGRELHERGRFHHARTSHLSGPFDVVDAHAAPRVLVSDEAVPWRPTRGLWVTVDALDVAVDVDAALALPGVAGTWAFAGNQAEYADHPWNTNDLRIRVWYLDDDPLAVGDALADLVGQPADGRIFSGPFETITPWEWNWFA
ncbi:MAG: hypothetical protein ACOYNI_03700 [Acidimicrobiia bacterium]